MKSILAILLILLAPNARAVDLLQIEQKVSGFELTFSHSDHRLHVQDQSGWITLNILTHLLFQKQIESSFLQPKKTKSILRQEPAHLLFLSAALKAVLGHIAHNDKNIKIQNQIEHILRNQLFTKTKSFTTNDTLLNQLLAPLLTDGLKETLLSVQYTKQGRQIASVQEPIFSNNPQFPLAYLWSQRGLKIPITSAVRSRQFLKWQPEHLKILLLK